MDLHPYGILGILQPDTNLQAIGLRAISPGKIGKNYFGDMTSITFPSGDYTVVKKLGQGTYGSAYAAIGPDSEECAIKLITLPSPRITGIVKEAIMQILLAEESKDQPNGPYVPMFYELAYSRKDKTMLLRSELLDGTVDKLMQNSTIEENDRIVPLFLVKIAKILDFFADRLAFNHRDLKGDNIMYKKLTETKIRLKIIDFGLSCMTWRGLVIRGEGYSGLKSCFKKDRDLSQLMYGIARYDTSLISDKLYTRLAKLLRVNVDPDHECEALDDCVLNGLKNWESSYNFFNRANTHMPYADPKTVQDEMRGFIKGEPFQGVPFQPTPITFEKPCGPGRMRNPVTRRCKKIPLPISSSHPKICPPGKILNPKTRRCVKDRTKI